MEPGKKYAHSKIYSFKYEINLFSFITTESFLCFCMLDSTRKKCEDFFLRSRRKGTLVLKISNEPCIY